MLRILNKEYILDESVEQMVITLLEELDFVIDVDDIRLTEIEEFFKLTNVIKYAVSHEYKELCIFGFEFKNGNKEYYYSESGDVSLFAEDK